MRRGQEVEQEDINFSLKMSPTHQTTVPSTTKLPSLKQSCHLPPKPRLEHYTQMHAKGQKSKIFWRKWDILSPPPLSKQTIQQRKASSTPESNQNAQKPWTCSFIGCAIEESTKNNSIFIGTREHCSKGITGQNITPPPITTK